MTIDELAKDIFSYINRLSPHYSKERKIEITGYVVGYIKHNMQSVADAISPYKESNDKYYQEANVKHDVTSPTITLPIAKTDGKTYQIENSTNDTLTIGTPTHQTVTIDAGPNPIAGLTLPKDFLIPDEVSMAELKKRIYGEFAKCDLDISKYNNTIKTTEAKKPATCECGSDHVGSPRHSTYCPKYKKDL